MAKRPNQYVEAALEVLKAAKQPMTALAITDEAMRRGLLDAKGKTPDQSMGAALYTSIKQLRSGSPFEQPGRGLFVLRRARGRGKGRLGEAGAPRGGRPEGSIFAAMGLFWSKADVDWSSKSLLGRLRASGQPANLWDQRGIYALYADFRLAYVGQAGSIGDGLRGHTQDDLAGRWDAFSWFGLRRVLRDGALASPARVKLASVASFLNHAEALLIAVAEPPQNGASGRWNDVPRYLQVRAPPLDEAADERIVAALVTGLSKKSKA
ncbi:MAG: winged helix-turn-helix domain-containing protein [Deltaproteobacteria bacterium]|nr:winged helix-turn-helix domain-containing protein [Deltaproteobacteria bacterium]